MNSIAQLSEIAILVHSIDYMLKCRIHNICERRIKVSPLANKLDMFQINDPVVCAYLENDELQLRSGEVKFIDNLEKSVEILIAESDTHDERRMFERYPVSLAVSARKKFTNKRLHFIAKNISQYGMGAISESNLEMDDSIDINLITGKYMFYFVGKVIWKQNIENGFEYGFRLTDFDIATKLSFEAYLGKLKDEYRSMYFKAR